MNRTYIKDSDRESDFVEVYAADGRGYVSISESEPPAIAAVSLDLEQLRKLRLSIAQAIVELM